MFHTGAALPKRCAETPSNRLCNAMIATLTGTRTRIGKWQSSASAIIEDPIAQRMSRITTLPR